MQTQGYVSRFEHQALRPLLHLEEFQLSPLRTPQRIQTQSSTQQEAQSQGTKPMHKAITSTQEGRHKVYAQRNHLYTKGKAQSQSTK